MKNDINETKKFLKEKLGKTFLLVVIAFIAVAAISTYYFYLHSNAAESALSSYAESVKDILNANGKISFLGVFKNNLFACVTSIIIGIIPFVFFAAISLVTNGIMIGVVLGYGKATAEFSVFKAVVFGMMPHGIFELPAIFLSLALGIYLCKIITRKFMGKANSGEGLLYTLNLTAKVFVLVIVPLLIVAALVECYITPIIINSMI